MASDQRHHLNDYRQRYRDAAAVGAWDRAKFNAILMRRYAAFTDTAIAECLYAEGYAREKLGDLRLAGACYELAVRLTGHTNANYRLNCHLTLDDTSPEA